MNKPYYLSVGIDVGADFSFMSIVDPQERILLKPFKIIHNHPDSLARAISAIKKAEELNAMKSRTFLESTGIYHFPLFCYLKESGFEVFVINPLITHSIKNIGIRKVKNDKLDSIGIAKLGLKPDLKTSLMPTELILELRSLTRNYYDFMDERASHVTAIKTALHTVFPQYLTIFSDILGTTSKMILRQYKTPENLLRGHKKTMIDKIASSSRKGQSKATECYEKLIYAASCAKSFGCNINSIYFNIQLKLDIIECLDVSISKTIERMVSLLEEYKHHPFVHQIHLLDTIPGVGLLTAVSIMCEIGDFSAFSSPKQLFAYFGMDPNVNESGKFKSSETHMSKRGSRIARRAIFAIALSNIRKKRNGEALNPYLYQYYNKKKESKPKMVAIGAIMHKITNIIFAVLRNHSAFELRSPEQHRNSYKQSLQMIA